MADIHEDDEEFGPASIMLEPPIVGTEIVTIDDAELARWQYLATRCGCRAVYHPWRMLRRQTRYRRLDEIAVRLRCTKCGQTPKRAWLHWCGGPDSREEVNLTIFPPEKAEKV